MEFNVIQLTDSDDISNVYDIFKHCMFMPTKEKFNKKIDTFLKDTTVKIFACLCRDDIKGVIVISFLEQYKIEIIGIAVDSSSRHQGIGSYMINKLIDDYDLKYVFAETDEDAVGFYCKNGFGITQFTENFDGETVIRYKCELVKK